MNQNRRTGAGRAAASSFFGPGIAEIDQRCAATRSKSSQVLDHLMVERRVPPLHPTSGAELRS